MKFLRFFELYPPWLHTYKVIRAEKRYLYERLEEVTSLIVPPSWGELEALVLVLILVGGVRVVWMAFLTPLAYSLKLRIEIIVCFMSKFENNLEFYS